MDISKCDQVGYRIVDDIMYSRVQYLAWHLFMYLTYGAVYSCLWSLMARNKISIIGYTAQIRFVIDCKKRRLEEKRAFERTASDVILADLTDTE